MAPTGIAVSYETVGAAVVVVVVVVGGGSVVVAAAVVDGGEVVGGVVAELSSDPEHAPSMSAIATSADVLRLTAVSFLNVARSCTHNPAMTQGDLDAGS